MKKQAVQIKTYIEPQEVETLEKAADNLRDRLLIRLLFHLGCRITEALELSVDDIDFSQGIVQIERLKTRLKLSCPQCGIRLGRKHTFCPGCGAKVEKAVEEAKEKRRFRVLPLDPTTLEMATEYTSRGGATEGGKLFSITRNRAWQVITDCARRAGLPDLVNPETQRLHHISPHRLRDAFAVHAVGVDDSTDGVRMLQEHLGHQNINTTMRYRKISGKEQRDWYDKLWGEKG